SRGNTAGSARTLSTHLADAGSPGCPKYRPDEGPIPVLFGSAHSAERPGNGRAAPGFRIPHPTGTAVVRAVYPGRIPTAAGRYMVAAHRTSRAFRPGSRSAKR